MANIELRFDSIAAYDDPLEATGTTYTLGMIDIAGAYVVFTGINFTYDIDGRPTGGTISSISLVVDDNGSDVVMATLTGINVSLDDVGDYLRGVFALRDQITWSGIISNEAEASVISSTYIRLINGDGTFTDLFGSGFEPEVPASALGTVTSIQHIAANGTTILTNLSVNVSLQAAISAIYEEAAGNSLHQLFNAGSNTFTGINQTWTVNGDDYSTSIIAGPGADTIITGPVASLDYEYATSAVTVNLNTNQVTSAWGNDTITGTINFVQATQFDDTLIGDGSSNTLDGRAGNDILTGNGGNDFLEGRDGDDTLDGGLGEDTAVYDYDDLTGGVTVSLALAGAQNTVNAGVDTLISIENLIGSSYNDILLGNGASNFLRGGGGDDLLFGGENTDYVYGEDGNDALVGTGAYSGEVYDGGDDNDTLVVFGGDIYDDPESELNGFRMANFTTGILLSLEALSFNVMAPENQIAIIGAGQIGAGQLATNLSIVSSSFSNVIEVEALGGALDLSTWQFDGGWVSITGGEFQAGDDVVVVIGNSAADTITGTIKGDRIEGRDGNDTLNGGDGDDSLAGGGGQDTLNAGEGDDFLEVSTSDLTANEALHGGNGNDLLYINFDTFNVADFAALNTTFSGLEELEFDSSGNAAPLLIARISATQAATFSPTLTLFHSDAGHADVVGILATSATTLSIAGWQMGVWGFEDSVSFADSTGDDNYTGWIGRDVILGMAGGVDTFSTGDGDDIFLVSGGQAGDTYNGDGGTDNLTVVRSATAISDPESPFNGFYESDYSAVTFSSIEAIIFSNPTGTLPNQLNSDKIAHFLGSQFGAGISLTSTIYGVAPRSDVLAIDATGGTLDLSGLSFVTWTSRTGDFDVPGDDLVVIEGASIADAITGTSVADVIWGNEGDDTIIGGGGEDTLDGGAGLDIVDGGAGNDGLDIFASEWVAGEDYDGGADTDTLYVTFDAGTSVALNSGTVSNIEAIEFNDDGQVAPFFLITAYDTILAAAPTTFSLTGSDGSAIDIFFILSTGGPGNINTTGWQLNNYATDWIAYTGSAGNDTYTGSFNVDSVRSGGGVDTYNTGDGNDIITTQGNVAGASYDGGAGFDVLIAERSDTTTTLQGISLYQTDLRTTSLSRIDGLYFGDPNQVLPNQVSDKVVTLGSGQIGGTGLWSNLVVTGVAGESDVIQIQMSPAGTLSLVGWQFFTWNPLVGTADAGEDFVQINGSTTGDHITGSMQGDYLFGLGGNDILLGAAGNDTIDGGAGADDMSGGGGDDFYIVDNILDTASEVAGQGTDTVRAFVNFTLTVEVENLILGGSGNLIGTGNASNNVITGNIGDNQLFGNGGNDTLNGGFGADAMTGGLGDDTYVVDNVGDTITEGGGGGTDTVQSSISFTLGAQQENLTLTGGGATNATGNGLNNILIGNTGWNVLNGGFGADTMSGGLGNETYFVDNVGDTVIEGVGEGIDLVNSTVSFTLGANVENLSFGGSANVDGVGNELNNKIIGNSGVNNISGGDGFDILFGNGGNDILDGGLSQDQMYGGLGDDTYYVNQTNDSAFENAPGEGTDIVYSSAANFTISAGVEHITLLEAAGAASKAIGNALNNNVTGNSFNNVLFGKDGHDTLDGGGGADTMYGGAGNDIFYVDNAGDVASENASEGTDTVISTVSYTLRANFENLNLSFLAGAINGTGNALGNQIEGNDQANIINGAGGDDRLIGFGGADTLIGGAGDDTFVFSLASGQDTVTGFVAGGAEDSIDLSAYDGSGVTWNITQVGADTLFTFTNGDTITLTGVTSTSLVQDDAFHYS